MALNNNCKQQKKVLILSAPIGSGHIRAANAIKEEFLKQDDVLVTMGSVFDFCPRFFGSTLLSSYLMLLNSFPYGYELLYKWGDQTNSWFFRYFVNWLFTFGAYNFIDKEKPDVIIVTHVTPAGIIAQYKKKYKKDIPLFGIITDYSMHKWWVYDEINAYIVADNSLFEDYLSYLKEGQELWDYGIPVHEEFSSDIVDKSVLKDKLGLPQGSFVCLLTGGGEGLLPMVDILKAWQKYDEKNDSDRVFFIAVCGKNNKMKDEVESLKLSFVKTFGYIDDIDEYMKVSDLLISKAGGVTITEAISCNLPVLVFKPLPGQEIINTEYLLSNEFVIKADSTQEICKFLMSFSSGDNDELKNIIVKQREKFKTDATKNIVSKIKSYLNLL